MAKCKFCRLNGVEGRFKAKCRFCKAEYEVNEEHGTGKLRYVTLAEPNARNLNLVMIQQRLRECTRIVLSRPEDALELLEDTWTEFATVVREGHWNEIDELVRLRKENIGLKKALKTFKDTARVVGSDAASMRYRVERMWREGAITIETMNELLDIEGT